MDETNISAGDGRAVRREEWRRILSEQQASGRKAAAFCRERGIPVWKFGYWRKALTVEETGGFVQMQASTAQGTASHVWVEAGRWRICITPGFDPATLRLAAEALTAS
jgi:hypothetical protein